MDWYGRMEWLLAELRQHTAWQNGQIAELRRLLDDLRQSLAEMSGRLSRLEERAPVQVGHIDYQFEQLKVERLDGTLVIGLGPGGTGTIEDLALAGTTGEDITWKETQEPSSEEEAFGRMRDRVRGFLSDQFPTLLAEQARDAGVSLAPDRVAAIVEDLEKQVDDRIRLYMARIPAADASAAGNAVRPEETGGTEQAGEAGEAGNGVGAADQTKNAGERPGTEAAGGTGAGHSPAWQREDEIVRRVLRDIRNAIPSYLQVFGNGGANEHGA